jgi:acetyl esterase/lipase
MLRLLSIAIVLYSVIAIQQPARGQDRPLVKTTHTFKTVGDVKIQADVYRPDDKEARPVVVWLHGGALIVGNRNSVPKPIADLCRTEGYVLVSFDYRLAPEVKLPAIIDDLEDAFRWLHDKGPMLFNADTKRVIVTGGSAGGYLTLTAGFRIKPRPTALVAYWGYGDVDGDWYTKPNEHYRKKLGIIDKDEVSKAVGKGVLTGTEGDIGKARGRYYLYLRQNGLWTKEVTGFDPDKDRSKFDPYSPVRNVTPDYPPTILIHGTEDTDVPYSLSVDMTKQFEKHRVKHELVTVKGAEHGLAGGDKKEVEVAHAKALAFIREHLKSAK